MKLPELSAEAEAVLDDGVDDLVEQALVGTEALVPTAYAPSRPPYRTNSRREEEDVHIS